MGSYIYENGGGGEKSNYRYTQFHPRFVKNSKRWTPIPKFAYLRWVQGMGHIYENGGEGKDQIFFYRYTQFHRMSKLKTLDPDSKKKNLPSESLQIFDGFKVPIKKHTTK